MTSRPRLRLDATDQFLATPLVGAYDNRRPVRTAVARCVDELHRISGH